MGRYKYILLMLIMVVFLFQGMAAAGEKTLYIKGSGITRNTLPVTITNQVNFAFTKNSAPISLYQVGSLTSTITDFRISSGTVYETSVNGRAVQINDTVQGNVYACTIWTPNVGSGNYYNYRSITMDSANWPNSTLIWDWNGLAVDYKAERPYKPRVSSFVETQTSYTDGTPSTSTLTVNSARGSGTDGLREVNAYAWKMWNKATESEPTEPRTGATGASLSLPASALTPGATYVFRVRDHNQWDPAGSEWSDSQEYKIGEGTGAVSVPYSLKKSEGGLGLNAIAALPRIPFNVEGTAVSKIGELVTAINTKSGANNTVATIGWMEDGSANLQGWYITYDASGTATYTPTAGLTTGADTPLVINRIYQISVLQNVDVTFSQ